MADVPQDVVDAEHNRFLIGRRRRRRGEGEHGAFVEGRGRGVQMRPKTVTGRAVDDSAWRLADEVLDASG
jgi:hypothetical protein